MSTQHSYVLENENEFNRLKAQSLSGPHQIEPDLDGINFTDFQTVLDAGHGSGCISSEIAARSPRTNVIGCDLSKDRVDEANAQHCHKRNLSFQREDLANTSFDDESFDFIFTRYTLEHFSQQGCMNVLKEFHRILRPGAHLRVIDIDGFLHNIFPQTDVMAKGLAKIKENQNLDLEIGRKLPHYLAEAGYKNINWSSQIWDFDGPLRTQEVIDMEQKFQNSKEHFASIFGCELFTRTFINDYLEQMSKSTTTIFYARFRVNAQKAIS